VVAPGAGHGADHDAEHTAEPGAVRVTAWLSGRVQGVGMRWWVRARALELGLAGHAANVADGRVEVVAEGPAPACGQLLALLGEQPSRHGRPGQVRSVTHRESPPRGLPAGFVER
jgi:acylphosphatase